MNGYGDIAANYEAANIFHTVCFTYVPYTPQEDVESYENQLEYGDPIFNTIYTSPGQHKSRFIPIHVKNKSSKFENEDSCYIKY